MQRLICEIDDFKQWVSTAKPNEKYIYYEGWTLTANLLSAKVRETAYALAKAGEVYLVQRKVRDYIEYISIKASKPPINRLVPLGDGVRKTRQRETREVLQWLNNRMR